MTEKRTIPLDFMNYPNLWNLFMEDKEQFATIVKGMLRNLDQAVQNNHHSLVRSWFDKEYYEFEKAVMDAFFDYQGILAHHENEAERESMSILAHEINPLAILTGKTYAIDTKGKHVPPGEWYHTEDITEFIQSLLYAARFVPLKDLAQYLSLGQYELVDVLKARNFDSLGPIQPALKFQESRGMVVGKFLKGTGFLDIGDEGTMRHEKCPACQSPEWNTDHDNFAFCPKCLAGAWK